IRSRVGPCSYGPTVSLWVNCHVRSLGNDHVQLTRAGEVCRANLFSRGTAMRKNLPVTTTEYPVTDETLIVSQTDTKGKLTFFNDDFIAAAGFTADELMGQPHNIIRHPDMPPEAFENLWDTLKAGKPWVGAVKNRRKNGDFYWVLATASPIRQNGHITGYTSVRTRLPADQRKEAEEVYAAIREKRPHGYKIEAGIIRRRSLSDRFKLFTGSLKARLITQLGVQTVLMLAVALAVLFGTSGTVVASLALLCAVFGGGLCMQLMAAMNGPLHHLNETWRTSSRASSTAASRSSATTRSARRCATCRRSRPSSASPRKS